MVLCSYSNKSLNGSLRLCKPVLAIPGCTVFPISGPQAASSFSLQRDGQRTAARACCKHSGLLFLEQSFSVSAPSSLGGPAARATTQNSEALGALFLEPRRHNNNCGEEKEAICFVFGRSRLPCKCRRRRQWNTRGGPWDREHQDPLSEWSEKRGVEKSSKHNQQKKGAQKPALLQMQRRNIEQSQRSKKSL